MSRKKARKLDPKAALRRRYVRDARARLVSNHVAIVRVGRTQVVMDWLRCRLLDVGHNAADAINEVPHRWTFYPAALLGDGFVYEELVTEGVHKADSLTERLKQAVADVTDGTRVDWPDREVIEQAFIALPYDASLTEDQVRRVYRFVGALPAEETEHA